MPSWGGSSARRGQRVRANTSSVRVSAFCEPCQLSDWHDGVCAALPRCRITLSASHRLTALSTSDIFTVEPHR